MELVKWLQGKKTYIIGVLAAATIIAQTFGWITPEIAQKALEALGVSIVFTMRAAINKPKV